MDEGSEQNILLEESVLIDSTDESKGRILLFIINRPDKLNALNKTVSSAIKEASKKAMNDDSVRVVIFGGAGFVGKHIICWFDTFWSDIYFVARQQFGMIPMCCLASKSEKCVLPRYNTLFLFVDQENERNHSELLPDQKQKLTNKYQTNK